MEEQQNKKYILLGLMLLLLLFFAGTGYTTTNYNYTSYINNTSGCDNCLNISEAQYNSDMNTKLNTSGGNLTGILNMTGIYPTRASLMDGKGIFMVYNDSIMRTQLSGNGVQEWKLLQAGIEAGYILYTIPGSPPSVGILFRNSTQDRRTQIWLAPDGLELYSSKNTSGTTGLKILNQDNGSTIQVAALAGTGNAYVCANGSGTFYRGNPTC